jgi:hypothetical protein
MLLRSPYLKATALPFLCLLTLLILPSLQAEAAISSETSLVSHTLFAASNNGPVRIAFEDEEEEEEADDGQMPGD